MTVPTPAAGAVLTSGGARGRSLKPLVPNVVRSTVRPGMNLLFIQRVVVVVVGLAAIPGRPAVARRCPEVGRGVEVDECGRAENPGWPLAEVGMVAALRRRVR